MSHKELLLSTISRKSKILLSTKGLEKKKNTWIPACPSWASSSHMLLTLSHFLLTLVNNFVQRRKEGAMDERIINVPSLNMCNCRTRTSAPLAATISPFMSLLHQPNHDVNDVWRLTTPPGPKSPTILEMLRWLILTVLLIGQVSFKIYLPSKKIYYSWTNRCDFVRKLS